MSEPKYPRIIQAVYSRPWALLPGTLALIVDILQFRAAGGILGSDEIEARIAAASNGPRDRSRAGRAGKGGAVAVIPIYGVISQRQNLMAANSGGTSVEGVAADFRQAMADEEVSSVVLDIDSPGGTIDGIAELAAEIRAARGTKPIAAQANTMAASAAYWIAAAADEVVVTPSGSVGSIGIFAAHEDLSEQAAAEGVKTTLVSAGKFKTEGNPWEPLSEDAKAHLQELVDAHYTMFVGDVAKGRGVPASAVRGGFGQGRIVLPKQALAEGMVDRIDTIGNTIARAGRGQIKSGTQDTGSIAAMHYVVGERGPETFVVDLPAPGSELAFGDRLALVSAESEELLAHARERVQMRAKQGRSITAADKAGLRAVADSLSALAGEAEEEAAETDTQPGQTWKGRAARLALVKAQHDI